MQIDEVMYAIYYPKANKWHNQHTLYSFGNTPKLLDDRAAASSYIGWVRNYYAELAQHSGHFAKLADWVSEIELVTVEIKETGRESV